MKNKILLSAVLLSAFLLVGSASAQESKPRLNLSLDGKNEVSVLAKADRDGGLHLGQLRHLKDRAVHALRHGKVTQLNTDGSFKVESANGKKSATVTTDASTTFQKDGQPATKDAVVVGAKVSLKGTFDKATSTIKASWINVIDKIRVARVSGTVTAIAGSTLTIRDDFGTSYSIDASAARFTKASTIADIQVGHEVSVWGTHLKDSTTISAKVVSDNSIKK